MAQITRQQVEELKKQGLSEDKIKSLAAAKGLTLPSESVKGVLGTLGRFTGVEKLGQGIGLALFRLTPEYKDLEKMLQSGEVSPDQFNEIATGNITTGEVVGSALRTGASVLGAGQLSGKVAGSFGLSKALPSAAPTATRALGNVARGAKIGAGTGAAIGGVSGAVGAIREGRGPLGVVGEAAGGALAGGAIGALGGAGLGAVSGGGVGQGALRGALTGLRQGAKFGAVSGLATGIEEGRDISGTTAAIAGEGIRGGVLGGAIGGVLGGVTGGIQTGLRNRALRKQEIIDSLRKQAESPSEFVSSKAAPYKIFVKDAGGEYKIPIQNLTKDKQFVTALKNSAVPADDLAIIKASSKGDYAAYKDMARLSQSDNVYQVDKPITRVGQTFLGRLKHIVGAQEQSGREIDRVARANLNKDIPQIKDAVDSFYDDLVRNGAIPDEKGNLNFEGSNFEDLAGIQRLFNTVWKRIGSIGNNGYKAHQLKRFIDEQVAYGKTVEGLTGSAERLLKGLRSSIDGALDASDEAYNLANQKYSVAANAQYTAQRLLGKDFSLSDDFANMRAGEVMARVLGNAAARPLQALSEIDNAARELGGKFDDNIIAQVRFADLLEDITGAPTRSLAGQVERATKRAMSLPDFVKQSFPFAEKMEEFLRDSLAKTPTERIAALVEYIELLEKASK